MRSNSLCKDRGLFVVLLGPDGCGKSTIANQLIESFQETNCKVHHFHWRPNLIPQLRKKKTFHKNDTPPPAPDNYAYGYFISFMRYIYYYLDFYFGYWIKIRRLHNNGTFIIAERWYFDVLIHPSRYGFKLPLWLLKFGNALLPSPDYTFLLSADPQAIHDRKPELTVEQISSQLMRMRALLQSTNNGFEINTGISIEESVSAILKRCGIDNG